MTSGAILDVARDGIMVFLKAGGPLMMVALIVGLAVSLIQALTQIQEQTLTFVPKIVVMLLVAVFLIGWITVKMLDFSSFMFTGT